MTRNLTADTLVETTTDELLTYLRSGTMNTQALAQSLSYDGLDIDDWNRLKRIHFCLADAVREFIRTLPERIRRVKTENAREHVQTQGEIRGSIDWGATLSTWAETGYTDQTRFHCDTPYTEYDIPENRVLKRLLWHVHRTVTIELDDVDYDWRRDYWTDDQITQFSRLYRQNVHVTRIAEGDTITVTGQDMNTARRSRLALYADAYDLFEKFQRLQADTYDQDVRELLAETLIIPNSEPTLFELFCIFRLLRILNESAPGFRLQPIDGTSDALANLETSNQRIDVYHDSTGTVTFHEPLDPAVEPDHPTFKRYQDALVDYTDTLESLTGKDENPVLYSGRPDLVIEVYDTTSNHDELDAVVIGEFKHSNSMQTFKQGLEELLKYRKFAEAHGYLLDNPDVTVNSLLITNGVTTSGACNTVTHLNGSDLLNPDTGTVDSLTRVTKELES